FSTWAPCRPRGACRNRQSINLRQHGEYEAMARKRTASYTTLMPDPVYGSELASKFINCLMWQGKKATAMRIFYGALDQIKKRMPDLNPIDVFTQAVEHVKPSVEVRSKRVGGATYQVPMQVKRERQQSLSI